MNSSSFSIVGSAYYAGTSVSFEISLSSGWTASDVLAVEWYLDDVLIIDESALSLNIQVAAGSYQIAARLLAAAGWTGIKHLSFVAGKVPTVLEIDGPSHVNNGQSVLFRVLQRFSDGSNTDLSALYVFSSSGGGLFNGNVFTANPSSSGQLNVNIYAQQGAAAPLSKAITVGSLVPSPGTLVIDLYSDANLNVIGIIDNAGVTASHVGARTGYNIVPVGSAPAQALILASDLNVPPPTNWRFQFNISRLVFLHPEVQDFILLIKGRSTYAGTQHGAFSVKTDDGVMMMNNAPGTYMPSVSGGTNIVPMTDFFGSKVAGANGSYNEADLSTIIRFNYNVPNKSLTYTLPPPPITVSAFDFMAVRYQWQQQAGTDLDILVGFENNGNPNDGFYVGFGHGTSVPAGAPSLPDAYLWWGSDSTGAEGTEAVLIGIKSFIDDYPEGPNIVEVGLYSVWFGLPGTGHFTIELVTYLGGQMRLQDKNFVNDGGSLVSSDIIAIDDNTKRTTSSPSAYHKIGKVQYNKTTQSAVITIL